MPYTFDWEGGKIATRARQAMGRGLVGIGEAVANEGKRNAHVISGTMRRSVHSAPAGYTGGNDESAAAGSDLPNARTPSWEGVNAALEVGSWVAYACVEEVGRGHAFMAPAVSAVGGARATALMQQAFAEAGLLR